MEEIKITTFKEAQAKVKEFAERNGWVDEPNIDKFEHVHQEISEIARLFLYKTPEQMKLIRSEKSEEVESEFGDLLFVITRLANQFDIDMQTCFNKAHKKIFAKYEEKRTEHKIV